MTESLWSFTQQVIDEIKALGVQIPKIEKHEDIDPEGSDFLFGVVTPELILSEGDYMVIQHEQGLFSYEFGTRACFGGDPTYGGEPFFEPTQAKAKQLALAFSEFFT
ncbi:hypothetical protein [Idiomarina abyssalis]|uniref:Uncharacterized protein n=1 Tax=Idiomarina abyssalis TaxID=86102 RepID=A0A8I1KID4_9GAMM|nr:hypothetical protein [Idiomarina abyssalis]MBJ7265419.1 hypothetical protein [Idiomarina abyssalis]MBJ7316907.1 hypothetical protein [Idiomarina abyssalis]